MMYSKNQLKIFIFSLFLFCFLIPLNAKATIYYVDATGGNDGNSGTSEQAAWKTISKVNGANFQAGDQILFKRGEIWREQLENYSAGVSGNPIIYGAYGSGNKPSIRGSDTFNSLDNWTQESGNMWYASSINNDPGVFVHDGILGARKTAKNNLASQWNYWYDSSNKRLYVFSSSNPASLASLLEIAIRDRFTVGQWWSYTTYENLDLRHYWSNWYMWGAKEIIFRNVDFSQYAKYVMQFNNGSNGSVENCTFNDWGLVAESEGYAIHVIGIPPLAESGPVDVLNCTFTINHSQNTTELAAVGGDAGGWLRNIIGNKVIANVDRFTGSAIWSWRSASIATSMTIERNIVSKTTSAGIGVQEIEYYGGHPDVKIRYNYIEDADLSDILDTEALRVRTFSAATQCEVSYNIINRTKDGIFPHPGIYLYGANSAKIYNNTITGTDWGFRVDFESKNNDIRNNIAVNSRQYGIFVSDASTGNTFSNNLIWNSSESNYFGVSSGAGDINSDPKFTNSSGGNFSLQLSSPAIDAGTYIGTSYASGIASGSSWPSINTLNQDNNGNSWEMGAYVFNENVAPTVSITSPLSGATVSSSVTISAEASDNTGIAGVWFKLDGSNLGSEDTTSPYSITWDTTVTSNGSHSLVAIARDAYNNYTTSQTVNVIVNNASAPPSSDTTAPAVITNLSTSSSTQNSVIISWTAPGDDGSSGTASSYDIRYSTSAITDSNWVSAFPALSEPIPQVAGTIQTYSQAGLAANTTYYFAIKTTDDSNNTSPLSNIVMAITSASSLPPSGSTAPASGSGTDQDNIKKLEAQIQELLAKIAKLKAELAAMKGGSTTTVPVSCSSVVFSRDLYLGKTGNDVKCLQAMLNLDLETQVAITGVGSLGYETSYFGAKTKAAVIKFQQKYCTEILAPFKLTKGNGLVRIKTRTKLNWLMGK